jgi:hypothetical protein
MLVRARRYLPPNEDKLLQGDIYTDLPSLIVENRPLRCARPFRQKRDGREQWFVHTEGVNPPRDGFTWGIDRPDLTGERATLAQGFVSYAMLMTHGCEIDHDDFRHVAMIRPDTHLSEEMRTSLFSGHPQNYALFPLEAQEEEPTLPRCFVDFRRITTVRPPVLAASTRHASLSDELREALAEAFWLFLFRRLDE